MNHGHSLTRLFRQAAGHEPFGPPNDFGFETRLRAALREADRTTADWIARFSFRFSATCLPLAVGVLAVLFLRDMTVLPDGAGGLVAQWLAYFPLNY